MDIPDDLIPLWTFVSSVVNGFVGISQKPCQAPHDPVFPATSSFHNENKVENHGTFTLLNLLR